MWSTGTYAHTHTLFLSLSPFSEKRSIKHKRKHAQHPGGAGQRHQETIAADLQRGAHIRSGASFLFSLYLLPAKPDGSFPPSLPSFPSEYFSLASQDLGPLQGCSSPSGEPSGERRTLLIQPVQAPSLLSACMPTLSFLFLSPFLSLSLSLFLCVLVHGENPLSLSTHTCITPVFACVFRLFSFVSFDVCIGLSVGFCLLRACPVSFPFSLSRGLSLSLLSFSFFGARFFACLLFVPVSPGA